MRVFLLGSILIACGDKAEDTAATDETEVIDTAAEESEQAEEEETEGSEEEGS